MPISQQKFREIVFQLIYSHDIGYSTDEDMLSLLMKELAVTRKVVKEAQELAKQVQSYQTEIDQLIANTSISYAFERIQSVERNILRLGIYELLYDSQIPPKVAIAEALRLARKFGTPESATFVNALLDNIYRSSQGFQADADQMTRSIEAIKKSEALAEEVAKQPPKETTETDASE